MTIMTSANSLIRRSELATELVGASLPMLRTTLTPCIPGPSDRGVLFHGAALSLGADRTEGRPA